MKKSSKKVIWSNTNLDIEDWAEFLEEEYPEVTDENEKYDIIWDLNNDHLEDVRSNLDIQLDNPILVICTLGLWNGKVLGYHIIKSGNIKDCLVCGYTYKSWYIENGNFKSTQSHHDGTNNYVYREVKNMDNIDNLLNKIYNNEKISHSTLNYYTKSIAPKIKEAYGW